MIADTYAPSIVAERVRELCRQFKLPTLAAETVGRFSQAGHADALVTLVEVMEQEAEDRRLRRVDRLSPNPPKEWRYSSGMGDEWQRGAMVRAGFRVDGSGGGLSAAAWRPCGRLQTLAGRDGGERTQQETLPDRG